MELPLAILFISVNVGLLIAFVVILVGMKKRRR